MSVSKIDGLLTSSQIPVTMYQRLQLCPMRRSTRRIIFWYACVPSRLILVGIIAGVGVIAPEVTQAVLLLLGMIGAGLSWVRLRQTPDGVWWDPTVEIFLGLLTTALAIAGLTAGWEAWILCLPLLISVLVGMAVAWMKSPFEPRRHLSPIPTPPITLPLNEEAVPLMMSEDERADI